MTRLLDYLLPVALVAVALVLLGGMANMARGGDPRRSQSLMRWRVGLQFAAVLVMLAILALRQWG
jgi:peptidoglycan biosynthesis protein MviN/MurJ (putative lipid II flippase)